MERDDYCILKVRTTRSLKNDIDIFRNLLLPDSNKYPTQSALIVKMIKYGLTHKEQVLGIKTIYIK